MARESMDILRDRGVELRAPASIEIGPEVDPERIAPGVVIHAGCRIRGEATSIGPDCEIGREAPATIENCQLGCGVNLHGGFFSGATFLDGASFGSSAHVRPGTLLEEGASCAHAVGLKQTILFPHVTTGSLVNFCDVLMAGGSSRRDHSEVGSSYVHFNFTPHGDKATASLIGDVPGGVFRDRPGIFLGGQGGLVGPARIAYGVVVPAGVVWRGDAMEPGMPAPTAAESIPSVFRPGIYRSVGRRIRNNLVFIGNLRALELWYRVARARFMNGDPFRSSCHAGALTRIAEALEERIRRLGDLAERMAASAARAKADPAAGVSAAAIAEQEAFAARWPWMRDALAVASADADLRAPDGFLDAWSRSPAAGGMESALKALSPEARRAGEAWLQAAVDRVSALWPEGAGAA